MATHQVYYIVYKQAKFLDFQTLLFLFCEDNDAAREYNRSTLWRYLKKKKYKSYQIKNFRIYPLIDILGDSYLIGAMKNIGALAKAQEEE